MVHLKSQHGGLSLNHITEDIRSINGYPRLDPRASQNMKSRRRSLVDVEEPELERVVEHETSSNHANTPSRGKRSLSFTLPPELTTVPVFKNKNKGNFRSFMTMTPKNILNMKRKNRKYLINSKFNSKKFKVKGAGKKNKQPYKKYPRQLILVDANHQSVQSKPKKKSLKLGPFNAYRVIMRQDRKNFWRH